MMHIHLRTTEVAFDAGLKKLATKQHLWAFGASMPTDTPGIRRVELYTGDATMQLTADEIAQAVRALLPQ
jgi:TPP-dependent 2-oxoacid decarboxylase